MHLYAEPSREFLRDSAHNQIARKLPAEYRNQFGSDPSVGERRSWRESLRALSQVIAESRLNDHGIILEYQLPLTSKRLDCLITGHDEDERSSAVIVEIKSWETSEPADHEHLVRTYLGGAHREVLHPCAQINQYGSYLTRMHEAFSGENAVRLSACAYLPNYYPKDADPLLADKFSSIGAVAPLYTADAVPSLIRFLTQRLGGGRGLPVMERIEGRSFRPGRETLATLDIGEVCDVAESIIDNYRYLIEHQGVWKLLYDSNGKPLHEHVSQRIFFVAADAYCRANNVDVAPEANAGAGRVDFKLSRGYHARAVVELKLSTNPHLSHGYAEQLEAYKRGERTHAGFFVVLYVEGGRKQLDRVVEMESAARSAGRPHSPIIVIDARRKRSASKL